MLARCNVKVLCDVPHYQDFSIARESKNGLRAECVYKT